jgi:hypothetical protein
MKIVALAFLNLVAAEVQILVVRWGLLWLKRFAGIAWKGWIPLCTAGPFVIVNTLGVILATGVALRGNASGVMPENAQKIWFALILLFCAPQVLWLVWSGFGLMRDAEEHRRENRN